MQQSQETLNVRLQVYEFEEPTAGAAEVEADLEAGNALEVSPGSGVVRGKWSACT